MSTTINKNQIKCAVFDLDGTLLNTIYTINHYLNLALEKNGLGKIDKEKCASFVGDGAAKLISRALDHLGVNDPQIFNRVFDNYNALYNSNPDYLTEGFEGVPEMLMHLRDREITLAVLSNKPDFATKATVKRFFPDTFAAVSGSKDGVPLKPHPDALNLLLESLGFLPAEASYIGDSEQDVRTADNAGVALGISVDWGFRSADQLRASGSRLIVSTPIDVVKAILN